MGINEVTLVGRLGADVATDKSNVGATPIARGSLAISDPYQDKRTKEWKEVVDWVQLRFYDKMSERAVEKLKKGTTVLIKGKIKTWRFERAGKTEFATAVKVEKFYVLKEAGNKNTSNPEPEYENNEEFSTPF